MGEDVFRAVIAGGEIDAGHGAPPSPDAVLTLDPGTLLALIHGEISVADALASGGSRSTATARRSSASSGCSRCRSRRRCRCAA